MKLSDLDYKPKIRIAESKGFFRILEESENTKGYSNLEIVDFLLNRNDDGSWSAFDYLNEIKPTIYNKQKVNVVLYKHKNVAIKNLLIYLKDGWCGEVIDVIKLLQQFGINWSELNTIKKSADDEMARINNLNEAGVGKIVKGVNTTADVKPGEIRRQAAKMGFNTSNDGYPPVTSPNGKFDQMKFKKIGR